MHDVQIERSVTDDEAIGIAQAALEAEVPVVLSFTVETDGNLPDGSTLAAAIQIVDDATDACPAFYMINCAHPPASAPDANGPAETRSHHGRDLIAIVLLADRPT